MLEIMFNTPELFKIDIITENNITKPPIIITVLIALIILVDKTSPKLEKVTIFFCKTGSFLIYDVSFSLYFQNLNKSPTIIHDNIWVINNSIPY